MRSTITAFAALALTLAGCIPTSGDGPVVVITTSYPKANAQVVNDTVAAPIEQQVNGVEGMPRLESECHNDGTYVARVRFKPNADPDLAIVLVQNRIALAKPVLPDAVWQAGVSVKVEAAKGGDARRVTIALTDRRDTGRKALQGFSEAVLKRLAAEKAIVEAEVFPGPDEKQARVTIDRAKCAEHGVTINELKKVIDAAGPNPKIEALKPLRVTSAKGDSIPLDALATIELANSPAAVFRVDMYPAVRITGSAPDGQTAESAAAKCIELADAERKKQDPADAFDVLNLTAR